MSHILSDEKTFAFIHIPKNGGSSLRDQVLDLDDSGRYLSRAPEKTAIGPLQMGHAPLHAIARLFPEDLTRIRRYRTVAFVRDPVSRFRSALFQRSREFFGNDLAALGSGDREKAIHSVLDHLREHPHLPAPEFCHFIRQADFVDLDGERIVGHLYPLERMDAAMADISKFLDRSLEVREQNRTVIRRAGRVTDRASRIWAGVRPFLPQGVQAGMRRRLRPVFYRSTVETVPELDSHEVRRFLTTYYEGDFALVEEVKGRNPGVAFPGASR